MARVLTPEQIARIYDVTDEFQLHRNWVVVPLAAADHPVVMVLPDGKVLIRAPGGASFDGWFATLRRKLQDLDLTRTPRSGQHDPPRLEVPSCAPPGSGSRRYLNWGPPSK